jgi:ATP-dependent Lon protease
MPYVVASGKPTVGVYREWGRDPMLLIHSTIPWTVSEAGAYTAALLEVLDPEQNHTFNDRYLEV